MKVIIEKIKKFVNRGGKVEKDAQSTKVAVVSGSKKSKKVVKKVSKAKKNTKSKSKKK